MNSKLVTLIAAVFFILQCFGTTAQQIKPAEVKHVMKKVADWQIEHFNQCYSGRKNSHHQLDWTNGALYGGMVK